MDQRVPWNQFTREDRKLRWAIAGVPYVTVVGYAGGLVIKNAPAPLGTQPKAAFSAAGIRVYRSVQDKRAPELSRPNVGVRRMH